MADGARAVPGARAESRAWRVVPGEDGTERGGRWGPANGDKAGCGAGEWRGAAVSRRVLCYRVAAREPVGQSGHGVGACRVQGL